MNWEDHGIPMNQPALVVFRMKTTWTCEDSFETVGSVKVSSELLCDPHISFGCGSKRSRKRIVTTSK